MRQRLTRKRDYDKAIADLDQAVSDAAMRWAFNDRGLAYAPR